MNFVCRLSPLLGLRPSSSGAGVVASVRVALSRAARIPSLTRVRRRLVGVTKLLLGETSRDDARVAPESRLDDRARVAELGLFPRPESDAIGLVGGPTPTTSTALRQCGFPRGLAFRATYRSRSHPAACLEPSGVGSKLVKDPSVVIVRGKTISGPLAVLPFTSPAAKIKYDANDLCENSLQFRRMFAFWHFFAESQLRKKICRIFSDSSNVAQIQMNVNQSLRGKSTLV